MFVVVQRKVHVLVSVRLLSVHGGLHASIFLSDELDIQEGHTVVCFIFPREDDATRGIYSVHVLLQFLCLVCVYQADNIVHISHPASRLTVLWRCGDNVFVQVLHVQVHNNGGYCGAHGYPEPMFVNSASNLKYVVHNINVSTSMILSILGWFSSSVFCHSPIFFLVTSHASIIGVLVNNDTTSYDTNDSPLAFLSQIPVNWLKGVLFVQKSGCSMSASSRILLSVCSRQLV